jgi:hypothetical protein
MVTEFGKISEVTEAAGPKMTIQVCRTSADAIHLGGSLCVLLYSLCVLCG